MIRVCGIGPLKFYLRNIKFWRALLKVELKVKQLACCSREEGIVSDCENVVTMHVVFVLYAYFFGLKVKQNFLTWCGWRIVVVLCTATAIGALVSSQRPSGR